MVQNKKKNRVAQGTKTAAMCGSNIFTDSEDPQEASDLLRWWEYNYLLVKSRRRVARGNPPVVT